MNLLDAYLPHEASLKPKQWHLLCYRRRLPYNWGEITFYTLNYLNAQFAS